MSKGRVPRYICRGDRGDRGSLRCQTVGSLRLDRAVVSRVLDAIQPVGIEAAVSMAANTRAEDEAKRTSLELALERARYEANRARRQFDAVDPENRLVASELEARWNRSLADVAEIEHRLAEIENSPEVMTSQTRAELMTLCTQLPAVWDHPDAPVQLKKRILRAVLNDIIVKPEHDSSMYRVCLHWAGGVHTEFTMARNKTGQHGRSADRNVVELIAELAKICPDKSAAAILNRLGYTTGQGKSWNASRVAGLRGYHHIAAFQPQDEWVTQDQAAQELDVSNTVVKRLIREGVLPARHVVEYAPWIIERKDLALPAVQQQIQNVRSGRRLPKSSANQQQFVLE
jgi:hypothetical protein